MSILFSGSNSDWLSTTNGLGLSDIGNTFTVLGWFKPTSLAYGAPWTVNSNAAGIFLLNDGTINRYDSGGYSSIGGVGYSANDWLAIYWKKTGSSGTAGYAKSGGDFTNDSVFTETSLTQGATGAITTWLIGNRADMGYAFAGEACCFRVFTANLSIENIRDEVRSPDPVAGSCSANWRWASSANLTDTVGSIALTSNGSGVSNGSTEPSEITAASTPKSRRMLLMGVG